MLPEEISVHDKIFIKYLSIEQIQERVDEIAASLRNDLTDKIPLFLAILNGAFIFAADLVRAMEIPLELSFIKISSYEGMERGKNAQTVLGLTESIKDRHVIVVEDIIDTGKTMEKLSEELFALNPASLRIVTLLHKPEAMQTEIKIDYIGFEVPDLFLIGYGLDYNKLGRQYADIFQLKPHIEHFA